MIKFNLLFFKFCLVCGLVSMPPLAAAPTQAAPPAAGWDPCAASDPQSLWNCWHGQDGQDTPKAAPCNAKTSCPLLDPSGRTVKSCSYVKSWNTGFKCIILCDYGGGSPWGSDGGNNCD